MLTNKINSIKNPLVLAPMEDVSHRPFRLLCKEFGADWVYTEFVSSEALVRSIERSKQKIVISRKEHPVTIQLYGNKPEVMVEAAKIVEKVKPTFIDINFGCPVKKVANKGAGAGILKNPPLMLEIAKEVVNAVNIPVSVKTRLGWDDSSKIIVSLAEKLQDVGIQMLAIHGRTRKQMYKGEADWELIEKVKKNPRMNIPIIGNGDIDSPQKAKFTFENYGVDAVMIGRAAIGRPWIFKEIKHYLNTGEILPDISLSEKINVLKRLLDDIIDMIGEPRGILQTRRHIAKMFKALPDFKKWRLKMLTANSYKELTNILQDILTEYHVKA